MDLNFTLLSCKGIEKISPAFELNKTLKILNLSGIYQIYFNLFHQENNISSDGFLYLSSGLMKNEIIEELYLDENNCIDKGRLSLFQWLNITKSLKVLSLSRTKLFKNKGANLLSEMLELNNSIKKLNISSKLIHIYLFYLIFFN